MAARKNVLGAASAASNVVRLPSAARGKPQNLRFSAQRATRVALRAETAHRFKYVHPHTRAADKEARLFAETVGTPALLIVAAMFKCLPSEMQEQIMAEVADHGPRGKANDQARVIMKIQRPMTYGDANDFTRALDRIEGVTGCRSVGAEDRA